MLPKHDTAPDGTWLANAIARFAADTEDLVPATRALLVRTIAAPAQHGRLIRAEQALQRQANKTSIAR